MKNTFPAPRPISDLEKTLGHPFSDKELYRRALTHPTYVNEKNIAALSHYEQMEFLGDAVLSFVVRDFLFSHYPNVSEGILSSAHSAVVKQDALNTYARRIDLGDYLYLGRGAQQLRKNPSTLENAFEALIAALYLDTGLEVTKSFILSFVADDLLQIVPQMLKTGSATDYKTRLQQFIQEEPPPQHTLRYEEIARTGPDHAPTFRYAVLLDDTQICEGSGSSIKRAQEDAARTALQYFGLEPPN